MPFSRSILCAGAWPSRNNALVRIESFVNCLARLLHLSPAHIAGDSLAAAARMAVLRAAASLRRASRLAAASGSLDVRLNERVKVAQSGLTKAQFELARLRPRVVELEAAFRANPERPLAAYDAKRAIARAQSGTSVARCHTSLSIDGVSCSRPCAVFLRSSSGPARIVFASRARLAGAQHAHRTPRHGPQGNRIERQHSAVDRFSFSLFLQFFFLKISLSTRVHRC